MSAWLRRHQAALSLSLRSTIVGVMTFVLGHRLGLLPVYWAMLTAVIVMQASVGASLKATLDRFIGTLGRRLCTRGPLSIVSLTEGARVTRQAITKHMHALAGAGLVRSTRVGRDHSGESSRPD